MKLTKAQVKLYMKFHDLIYEIRDHHCLYGTGFLQPTEESHEKADCSYSLICKMEEQLSILKGKNLPQCDTKYWEEIREEQKKLANEPE